MGESPQAIFTWENALTAADTISANCDFGMLVAICSQLADVYHAKLFFLQEIHCLHTSSNYSFKDGDTIYAIDNLRRIGSCYTMLNKDDSAEYYYRRAQTLYRKYGFTQAALLSSTPLIYLYLRQGQLLKAKVLMDRYESEFEEFSNNHELPPRRRQYFCYKAYYYEQQEQLDSAEIFYRKAFRPKMDYISRSPIYAGLLRVYQQLGLADSIVKYARLYCTVNDSALAVSDRELTAQAAASYNYTRSQNEAISQRERASALAIALTTLTALLLVIATITIAVVRRNRERRKRQSIQIARLKHDLHTTQAEYAIQEQSLTQMQTLYTSSMELLRNDVNKLHRENEEDKNKLRDYQRQLNAMSAAYEENITMLSTDIERKRRRIETLEHLLDKNETSQTLADFENTEIVRHIKDMVANYEQMTRHDCNALIKAGNIHYPQLMEDLRNNRGITSRAIQVCLLLLICDRVEDIANLMGVKGSRVTNLKGDISLALFGKKDSRSLTQNLSEHYGTPVP